MTHLKIGEKNQTSLNIRFRLVEFQPMKLFKTLAKQRAAYNFVPKRSISTTKFSFDDGEKQEEPIKEEKKLEDEYTDLPKSIGRIRELELLLQEKTSQTKEYQHKYMTSLADQENTRRIAKQDVDNAKKFALQSFALSLLEVADNLGLCLKTIPAEKQEELVNFVQGIKMTENVLMNVFRKNQILRIEDPTNQPFDPKFHEALMKIENKEIKSGNMLKTGYLYNDRVIRAVQVVVIENSDE
jgi:molecular chaperone GrpE